MSKEVEPRPFKDTQYVYRKAVDDLIKNNPSIARDDDFIWQEAQFGNSMDVPDSISISVSSSHRKPQLAIPLSVPLHKSDLPKNLRTHSKAQVYLFGDEIYEDVGASFGVSFQDIQQTARRGVRNALELAPQAGYDFDLLSFKKPLSDKRRDEVSLRKGGTSIKIRAAIENGATYKELKEKRFGSDQIRSARTILGKRNVPVAVPINPDYRDWYATKAVLEDPATDRLVVQELLFEANLRFLLDHSNSENGKSALLTDIYGIARKAELYPRLIKEDVAFLADYLLSKCVPVGKLEREVASGKQKGIQRYNFTTLNFVNEAVGILQSAQGERFDQMRVPPVRMVGPTPEKIPTTTDFVRIGKKRYTTVFSLLKNFGVTHPSQLRTLGSSLTDLVGQNPPVTVFGIAQIGTFVEISKEDELKQYLGERLEEIRSKQ